MADKKNQKVIVVNGFARGGTNILWNIYQSHPHVCSPIYETGEILFNNKNKLLKPLFTSEAFKYKPVVNILGRKIDKTFYEYKKRNYEIEDNKFKYENIPYEETEIEDSVLCIKSLNNDIALTDFFNKVYRDIYFVGLVRNGYALCEGWVRRGKKAKDIGVLYRKMGEKMINDSQKLKNYTTIKFEDILKEPFMQAENLYSFAELEPRSIPKLRFKSKKLLSKEGSHLTKFGQENKKYWFDQNNIETILNPNTSSVQIEKLSSKDFNAFEKEARPVLEYFNYYQ